MAATAAPNGVTAESSGRLYGCRDLVVGRTGEHHAPARLGIKPSGALYSVDAWTDDTRSRDRR